jgi:acylphosphatase
MHEDRAMTGSHAVAREVVVHGRVQGVGFRLYCQQQAEQQGLAGWVTNEPDGSVRAWFEGSSEQVEAMLTWCGQGPPSARVERVDVVERDPRGLDRFGVR